MISSGLVSHLIVQAHNQINYTIVLIYYALDKCARTS